MPRQTYRKNMDVHRTTVPITGGKPHERFCENNRNKLILVAIGALIGFLLCMAYILWIVISKILTSGLDPQADFANVSSTTSSKIGGHYDVDNPHQIDPDKSRDSLYIGVLTLQPYLDTRARACNDTWGQNPGVDKLEFYAEMTPPYGHSSRLPMVPLSGSEGRDAWHTEKSLLMLEHMCSHHVHQYNWFLRAVDDAYIDVERLRKLLNRLDENKETLLGHPTLPIDDTSFKALNGREYCLGGPGLLFSRPLLQRVCPHLPSCRERLKNLPADVAIAKCVSESTAVECVFLPQLHDYFVHSFEKNQFHLLDEFSRQDKSGITYHPLKQPWMMHALHHKINTRRYQQSLKELEELKKHRAILEAQIQDQQSMDADSDITTEQDGAPITYLTSDGYGYTSDSCVNKFQLKESEKTAYEQAVRLADTSLTWGHSQTCIDVFSALQIQLPSNTLHIIDMDCQNRQDTSPTLARAVLSRPLADVSLLKTRSWKTSRHLVIVIKAQLQDPNLVEYLLRLRDVVREFRKNVILNIIYEPTTGIRNTYHIRGVEENIIKDLTEWALQFNIEIRTHIDRNRSGNIYKESLSDLAYDYRDATVLFTSIQFEFGKHFLQRCLALVKEGLQFYNPQIQSFPSVPSLFERKYYRPLCIHMQDYIVTPTPKGRRQKYVKTREPLLVITAVDIDLKFIKISENV